MTKTVYCSASCAAVATQCVDCIRLQTQANAAAALPTLLAERNRHIAALGPANPPQPAQMHTASTPMQRPGVEARLSCDGCGGALEGALPCATCEPLAYKEATALAEGRDHAAVVAVLTAPPPDPHEGASCCLACKGEGHNGGCPFCGRAAAK